MEDNTINPDYETEVNHETEIQDSESVQDSESLSENDNTDVSGTDDDASSADDGSVLTDRSDALISDTAPEDVPEKENISDGTESVSGNSVSGSESPGDSESYYNDVLLDGINDTLLSIKSDNASYHAEIKVMHEQLLAEQKHIGWLYENMFLMLCSIGFFVSLFCGSLMADAFFRRMKSKQ